MVRLAEIGMDTLEKIPNIMKYIEGVYGYSHPVMMYAVLESDNMGFVIRDGNSCTYIVNNDTLEFINFTLSDDNFLCSIDKDDYHVEYNNDDITVYTDLKNNVEMSVIYDKYDQKDLEGYDGSFVFSQYKIETDTRCEIHYPHMYRVNPNGSNPKIYKFNLKEIQSAFIDSQYYKKGPNKYGLIRNGSKYFHKITVYEGDIDYSILAIKDYGMFDVLSKGSYSLVKKDKVDKYCTIKMLVPPDYCCTFFPMCETYEEEDIKKYISDKGFLSEVPDFVLNEYNGDDSLVNDIKDIAEQIAIVEEQKQDNKRMLLVLCN